MMTKRILVVDDEEDLCEILQFNLENEGYIVDVAHSAEEALEKDLKSYDLLLLDVMMGEMSGFKLGSILRKEKETKDIPIIFITARDTENDTLTGFSIGADDYISKPFSIREVIARVNVAIRRNAKKEKFQEEIIGYHDMEINLAKKKVFINKNEIVLTKKEFGILLLLVENRNQIFSREDILAKVWDDEVYVLERTVDVNINRLRKKIGVYGKNLTTRLGYGYCFETED